jgi:ABC-type Fe3+ transport system permease subunit
MYNPQAQQAGYGMANTSGQGAAATIPAEIQGLNWGGFLLSWIWGIGNSVWIALLAFIPFVNIIVPFYLLFKGNELAWRAKQWDSVEAFQATQRKWAIAGLVILVVAVLLACVGGLLGGILGAASSSSN